MSSTTVPHPPMASLPAPQALRFGVESSGEAGADGDSMQWLLKRNCSATPAQMLGVYASLCSVSAVVCACFWFQGATLITPFASLELLAIGAALLVYARHATDCERIRLQPGRLLVEHASGRHVERAEFMPAWVRIEPAHGDRSLIELSGQGQRIEIGRFVRPEARRQLADELRWALRRWQGAASARVAVCPTGPQDKSEN